MNRGRLLDSLTIGWAAGLLALGIFWGVDTRSRRNQGDER